MTHLSTLMYFQHGTGGAVCACCMPGLLQWQMSCHHLLMTLCAFTAHPAGGHLHPKAACCEAFLRKQALEYKTDAQPQLKECTL